MWLGGEISMAWVLAFELEISTKDVHTILQNLQG